MDQPTIARVARPLQANHSGFPLAIAEIRYGWEHLEVAEVKQPKYREGERGWAKGQVVGYPAANR